MTTEIDEILAEMDDSDLCQKLYAWLVARHGDFIDLSTVSEHERVVLSVWHTAGIIGNGGFNYLFEGNIDGDPHYLLTADAFRAIGSQEAVAAFERVFRLFPEGKPPVEVGVRLSQYRQGPAAPRHEIDRLFWKASREIHRPLAAYVRANADAFRYAPPVSNVNKPIAAAEPRPAGKKASGRRDEMPLPDRIAELPHWARVALAGRCARLAFPEFRRTWPNALPKRLETMQRCIAAAERSALQGRLVESFQGLTTDAMVLVGSAMIGLSGSPFPDENEPRPADGNLAVIAARAARVGHMAAEAAGSGPDKSANYTAEAVSDTIDLAREVENNQMLHRLAQAITDLERAAERWQWDDDSPVSPEVFTKPTKRRRPWWKFW